MELEELAQRVAALETQIGELRQETAAARELEAEIGVLRQEAAAARALAAGADRDVADYRAELRGHTRTLNAPRETQVEQGQAIVELTATVGHIRDQHGARLNDIVGLLSRMIDGEAGPQPTADS